MIDEAYYLLVCQRYIELNPVRAGMVTTTGEYAWSSYWANGLGQPIKLWTLHRIYNELGAATDQRTTAYRELFRGHLDTKRLHQIRRAVNKGMTLGSDKFKQEVERISSRRVTVLKRGPKPKRHSREEFLLCP